MKVRPEEKQAMELLSRCVYTDKKLFLDDKPDIQSEDLSVGIEHRYITTPSAEMQAKFSAVSYTHLTLPTIYSV